MNTLNKYYFGRCSSELAQLVPLPFFQGMSTPYFDRLHDFLVTIPRCYKDVYVNSFFLRTARLWNFLPIDLQWLFSLVWSKSQLKKELFFSFFQKVLFKVKVSGLQLSFNLF